MKFTSKDNNNLKYEINRKKNYLFLKSYTFIKNFGYQKFSEILKQFFGNLLIKSKSYL